MKLKIDQYDTILLKDGRSGCVVEVWSDFDFGVDIGSSPADWETITITLEDIAEVILSSTGLNGKDI